MPIRRLQTGLDAAAEFWLGYEQPPLTHVQASGIWSPDNPSDYCHRCGESVGPGEATDSGCAACRTRKVRFDRFVRLGRYDNELRDWILSVKFHRRWEIGRTLGRLLGDAILDSSECPSTQVRIIVAIPMPWTRRLYRGVDHAAVIAAGVADKVGGFVARPLVHRNGPPQMMLSATDRRRFARSLLRLRGPSGPLKPLGVPPLADAEVILVDDVRTTGGTLDAAARLIRDLNPARVIAAVLAVADAPGRTGGKQVSDVPVDAQSRVTDA